MRLSCTHTLYRNLKKRRDSTRHIDRESQEKKITNKTDIAGAEMDETVRTTNCTTC